jgi:hypothetical protein
LHLRDTVPTIAALVLVAVLLTPLSAGAAAPTLTASLSPASAPPGAQTPFTLTVASDQGTVTSLTLQAPVGFVVKSPSRGSVSGDPPVISVGGLKVSGSMPLVLTFDAWPACTPQTAGWTLDASQKNGTAYQTVQFSTRVEGASACKLSLSGPGDSLKSNLAVAVAVKRADGSTDETYKDAISLSVEHDPGAIDAGLTGGGPTLPTKGVASFNASVKTAGAGYVLEACSATVAPCTQPEDGHGFLSEGFQAFDARTHCTNSSDCFADATGSDVAATRVSASSGASGDVISAGVWNVGSGVGRGMVDCADYTELSSDAVTFEYTGNGLTFVRDTVSASVMKEIPSNGVSALQTCYASPVDFPTARGTAPTYLDQVLGMYVGLLPNCPANAKNLATSAPCNLSKTSSPSGQGVITYVVKDADPTGRH